MLTLTHCRSLSVWAVRLLACCLMGGLLLPGCSICGPRVWVEQNEELTIPAAGLHALDVSTHNGPVEVRGQAGSHGDVVVRVRKRGGGPTRDAAQDALNALQVISERTADGWRLACKWDPPRHFDWQGQVHFDVTMPADVNLIALSHNGQVCVTGLEGEAILRTHNGRVRADDMAGRLDVETHNGNVQVATSAASARCVSHNGQVVARLTEAGPVETAIESYNGGVRVELPSATHVTGSIITHNGHVTVRLGEAACTTLDCGTHNGRIRCDLPLTGACVQQRHVSGQVGEGGPTLAVESYNGGIDLELVQ